MIPTFVITLREGVEASLIVGIIAAFLVKEGRSDALRQMWIGVGLYRGGVRINLTKFFRITGLVLVFVAAGLLATAAHTAHEAGWINNLQGQALDLSWLVQPGTISGSLLTGMLGLQPAPTVIEVLVYLLYAVPMALYVVWPDRLRRRRSQSSGVGGRQGAPAGNPA